MGMAVRCCASSSNNVVFHDIILTNRSCCCFIIVTIMYTYTARISLITKYRKAKIKSSLADIIHNKLLRIIVWPIALLLSVHVLKKTFVSLIEFYLSSQHEDLRAAGGTSRRAVWSSRSRTIAGTAWNLSQPKGASFQGRRYHARGDAEPSIWKSTRICRAKDGP